MRARLERARARARRTDGGGLRGAAVSLRCPGQQDLSTTTDHDGLFELGGRGPGPSLDCSVSLAAPAFAPARVSLAEACEDARDDLPGHCEVAMVEAELRRR